MLRYLSAGSMVGQPRRFFAGSNILLIILCINFIGRIPIYTHMCFSFIVFTFDRKPNRRKFCNFRHEK